MISSRFAVALRELHDSERRPTELFAVLQVLEMEARNIEISTVPIAFVANTIHQLYKSQSRKIRSILLKICEHLESASPTSILEEYHLDKLVSMSLEQQQDSSVRIEEESAFGIIYVLLKKRKQMPKSILRALIACYDNQIGDRTLILEVLLKTVKVVDPIPPIPELEEILANAVLDEKCNMREELMNVICYGLEKRIPCITSCLLACKLIHPFSQIGESLASTRIAAESILSLCRTWPGLLTFGLEMNGFQNLLTCIPHRPREVVDLLQKLLVLNGPKGSVIDGYMGFVLSVLLKLKVIDSLIAVAPFCEEASAFLGELITFASYTDFTDVKFTCTIPGNVNAGTSLNWTALNTTMVLGESKFPMKVTLYDLPDDASQWNWDVIHSLVTVILPNNILDPESAEDFYHKLLKFLSSDYINHEYEESAIMGECLCGLFELMVNEKCGEAVCKCIQKDTKTVAQIKAALQTTVQKLKTDSVGESHWAFFRCITILMSTEIGVDIMTEFHMHSLLNEIGECSSLSIAVNVLRLLKFYPLPGCTVSVYSLFLRSSNIEITRLALEELARKRTDTPNYETDLFEFLVLQFVKQEAKDEVRLEMGIKILYEFISGSDKCLETAAKDPELIKIVAKSDHHVLCLLLKCKEAVHHIDLAGEIDWWMETGNLEYVSIYDNAVSYSFDNEKYKIPDHIPSIKPDGISCIPSHLFGELSKLAEGRNLIESRLPRLISQIHSNNTEEIRAAAFALAHFASVPGNSEIVEKYNIADALLSRLYKDTSLPQSYLITGTLITCMTLFHVTVYVSTVVQQYNWQLMEFGKHSCIIPCDYSSVIIHSQEASEDSLESIEALAPEDIRVPMIELVQSRKETRNQLLAVRRECQGNPDVALAASILLSQMSYTVDDRSFIYGKFCKPPLVKPATDTVDRETQAHVRAQIFEIVHNKVQRDEIFSNIEIPKMTLDELKRNSHKNNIIAKTAAEVYLSDDEFKQATEMTKQAFYALSDAEQAHIRLSLMQT